MEYMASIRTSPYSSTVRTQNSARHDENDTEYAEFSVLVGILIKKLEQSSIFQQDSAPSHTASTVIVYLERKRGDTWISKRGHINWPAKSLDLYHFTFPSGAMSKIRSIQIKYNQ